MVDDGNGPRQPRPSFLAGLSAGETIVAAIIALLALAGLLLIGKGFYMKAATDVSRAPLSMAAEAGLPRAANAQRIAGVEHAV